LSENTKFAKACKDNGIAFVGPTPEQLAQFGDKTSARELAISCNVPVVPGTPSFVTTFEEVLRNSTILSVDDIEELFRQSL
jgi:pyruvate carboxylase